jgi:hypothetical protein
MQQHGGLEIACHCLCVVAVDLVILILLVGPEKSIVAVILQDTFFELFSGMRTQRLRSRMRGPEFQIPLGVSTFEAS